MKKKLLMFFLLFSVVVNAATYRVKCDNTGKTMSFIVKVENNKLAIGKYVFSLKYLGQIYDQATGLTFYSYSILPKGQMFCVSTSKFTMRKKNNTLISGYVIMIKNKGYIADRIVTIRKRTPCPPSKT